jgi:hypothetical protein
MTTTNIPREAPENLVQNPKTVNIHGLLKSAIEREFGSPMNPVRFDSYKKQINEIQNRITIHMYDLKWENPIDWNDVTDEMIESEAQRDTIIERLNYMSRNLILWRKRATERALELFPSLPDLNNWLSILRSEIMLLDEDKLQNLSIRTSRMKQFIYRILPDLRAVPSAEMRKFEILFHDKENYFDIDWLKKLERIFSNYNRYSQSPSGDDISFILSGYKSVSDARKKDILMGLWVTLTIKDAYHEFGLIDDVFLRTFAQKEWDWFFHELPDEKKDAFIRTLSYNESQVLGPKDLSPTKLTEIFMSDKKRARLSTEISRAIGIDVPERDIGGSDILSEIRQEKKKEAEMLWKLDEDRGDSENYELHDAFVDKMERVMRGRSGLSRWEHIEKLKQAWSVIQFTHGNTTQFVKLIRFQDDNGFPLETKIVWEYGIELQGFSISDGRVFNAEHFTSSYDTFARFLWDQKEIKILTAQEFETLFTQDESEFSKGEKFFDARTLKSDPITKENIGKKIDLLDGAGSAFWFERGTCFIAPSYNTETWNISTDEIWRIENIHDDMVDLMDAWWYTLAKNIPLSDVYETLSNSEWFKRIYKIESDADMVHSLQEFDLDSSAVIEWWKLLQKYKDDHNHEVKKEITCFKSESGEHIRIESFDNWIVKFGEFNEWEKEKLKKHAEKNGYDKVVKSYYDWTAMSYPAFLKYLAKNKLKATTKDVIVPGSDHHWHEEHHHPPHAHTEWSFFKRLMMMQNPASIWKGFEMIYHSIEHTLEKWAKLDAARFAMGTASFLGLPDSVSAQIYADIVDGSKEIIEKYEKKIFGLPGPRGREKCIHIVHNRDSRPEEVMSAVNYMIKSYGHLYAEDIKHYQPIVNKANIESADPWYFAFFDALVMTTKVGDLKHWRKEAYNKAIGEMWTPEDHENEPTEEQLIHAFCKTIDGDWEDYPYAASVVKAMGWPSGFEKNWKFEGYDGAYKKGKEQTQMVSIRGRLNKAMGYFGTHEIYKVVGAMEAVAGKTKAPVDQVVPFIWAVGGFSRYASHTALQKLKGYAGGGMTFHAYAFLRNEAANNLYRDTVRLALEKKGGIPLVNEFDKLCKNLEFDANNPKATKWAAPAMMEFWQKHCNSWLHDMLQGQNGWLLAMQKKWNKTAAEYMKTFDIWHTELLDGDSIPGDERWKDWYDEHGYKSLIMSRNSVWQRGLSRMLNKILFEWTSPGGWRSMKDDHYKKIWQYVKQYMQWSLHDSDMFLGDEALQKEQYLAHRKEILNYFSQKLNTGVLESREWKEKADIIMMQNIREYPYYRDLADMGITPQAVFNKGLVDSLADSDYKAWKSGVPRSVGKSISWTNGMAFDVKDLFQEKAAHVVTEGYPDSRSADQNWIDPDSVWVSHEWIVDLADN